MVFSSRKHLIHYYYGVLNPGNRYISTPKCGLGNVSYASRVIASKAFLLGAVLPALNVIDE
jgi:hypothetical protein